MEVHPVLSLIEKSKENSLKINITLYGEFCFLVNLLKGYSFEKFFTSKKFWDGLQFSGNNGNIEGTALMIQGIEI